MQPAVTAIKSLNIVVQVNILSARLTVLLQLVNIGTSLVMFWMLFTEDALIVQVRLVTSQALTIWSRLIQGGFYAPFPSATFTGVAIFNSEGVGYFFSES